MPGAGLALRSLLPTRRLRGPRLSPVHRDRPKQAASRPRVGLLGGSFNPAHEGHVYVSTEALKRLRLDAVWWLVSPQNPLKSARGMAPLPERVAGAKWLADHPRIRVTALESRLGTQFTVDTVTRLSAWGTHDFVWLLGADNLEQLQRWRHWRQLSRTVPIAVFARAPYSHAALRSGAAMTLANSRHEPPMIVNELPAWTFMHMRAHPASSTDIRARGRRGPEN